MIFTNPYVPTARKVDPLDDLARQRGRSMPSAPTTPGAPSTPWTAPPPAPPPPQATPGGKSGAISGVRTNLASAPNPAPAGATNPQDGALDSVQQQHDAETKATMQQLAASRAQQLQDAASRSNLGGFGLSGAATGLETDTANAADRSSTLALADLKTKQNNEDFQAIQRQAALDDLEASEDQDLNHDGKIGGLPVGKNGVGDGNPDNNPDPGAPPGSNPNKTADRNVIAAQQSKGGKGTPDDPYGGIGGYGDASQQTIDTLKAGGLTFSYERTEYGAVNGERYILAIGSDGKTYKFKVPGSGVGKDMPNDPDGQKWFAAYEGGQ